MSTMFWIGMGGFLGANLRYLVGRTVLDRYGPAFPWGTLLVNVTGALLIGLLFEVLAEQMVDHPQLRLLVMVGFLGGYTTFSTFALETVTLLETDRIARAAIYVAASTMLALIACYAGMLMGRRIA